MKVVLEVPEELNFVPEHGVILRVTCDHKVTVELLVDYFRFMDLIGAVGKCTTLPNYRFMLDQINDLWNRDRQKKEQA